MMELYRNFAAPLSHDILFSLHSSILSGRTDLENIGSYRTHLEPMQVVSGPSYKRRVHFEAPASSNMEWEMTRFIEWFNNTAPNGDTLLPALTRASIAHLYFVCIHPFEDGNGRIARAIAIKALSQAIDHPMLLALSNIIQDKKKAYYDALDQNNKTLRIDGWLSYFANTILDAQTYTESLVDFLIYKTKMMDKLRNQINTRQEKALLRMFQEGPKGFTGGLSADNYMKITDAPRATTTRDLQDLVHKGALIRIGERKATRYHLSKTI